MSKEKIEAISPAEILTPSQQRLAVALFNAQAVQFDFDTGWRLKHHENLPDAPLSPFYIDLRVLQSRLPAKREAVSALIEQTQGLHFDYLAGIPFAAVPLASSMADRLGKPQITPRMEAKTYGQVESQIDGRYQPGETVLVVDDLITRADSKLAVIKILKNNGLRVRDVAVIFDRQQGGAEQLTAAGYFLHAVLKIKPTLEFYAQHGYITFLQLNRLLEYLENPLG